MRGLLRIFEWDDGCCVCGDGIWAMIFVGLDDTRGNIFLFF